MAIETHQEYGVVTYDLAVAINIYSIQALDAPRFEFIIHHLDPCETKKETMTSQLSPKPC